MAYDLKYEGTPMFWSWPSEGKTLSYTVDEDNVRWTESHLADFLREISENSGATSIDLVAHSMGNRCLTMALRRLVSSQSVPLVREVVLTAPDIDMEVFKDDIAPAIVGKGPRITLYASSNDKALQVSRGIHGFTRAGEAGDGLLILPPIETIDASAVDTTFFGHSYYGDNDSVLSDIFYLLHDGKAPAERFGMETVVRYGNAYWVFKPRR